MESKTDGYSDSGLPKWVQLLAFRNKLGASRWKWAIIIIPLLLFAIFAYSAVYSYLEEVANNAALRDQGVTANATVYRKWTEEHRSTSSGTTTTTTYRYIEYSFDGDPGSGVDDINIMFAEQEVSQEFYDSVRKNDKVTVTFLPDNPEISSIEFLNDEGWALFAGGFFAFLALLMVPLAIANWRMDRYKAGLRQSILLDPSIEAG